MDKSEVLFLSGIAHSPYRCQNQEYHVNHVPDISPDLIIDMLQMLSLQRVSTTPLKSGRKALPLKDVHTPGWGEGHESEIGESDRFDRSVSQWESLMANGRDKLSVSDMLSLASQRKVRIEQVS